MSWRRWAWGLPVVALLAVFPIAHASPVDPAWMAGFWDDSDPDNVVLLVTTIVSADMTLIVPPVPVLVVASVATHQPETFSSHTFPPTSARAPPLDA